MNVIVLIGAEENFSVSSDRETTEMERRRRVMNRKHLLDITNTTTTSTKSSSTSIGSNNPAALLNPRFPYQIYKGLDFLDDGKSQTSHVAKVRNKDKGKTIASTPLPLTGGRSGVEKEEHVKMKLDKEQRSVCLSKSCKVPFLERKKEQRFLVSEQHCMSPDFVYKQKTYFSEIDAFELAEEVVSESDLE